MHEAPSIKIASRLGWLFSITCGANIAFKIAKNILNDEMSDELFYLHRHGIMNTNLN